MGNQKTQIISVICIMLILAGFAAAQNKYDSAERPTLKYMPFDNKDIIKELPNGDSKGRFLIVYKNKISDDDELNLEKKGARVRHRLKNVKAIAAELDEKEIKKIRLDPNVESVVQDMRVHVFLKESVPQISANLAHSSGITGSGVKVCIVDTGVDDSHAALNNLIAEHDFVNNDSDATDDHGHGTHVAGIIASNDATYRGAAYNALLMAAKVLNYTGSGWSSDVIAGIEWCVENGADVISMSLGSEEVYIGTCDFELIAQASNNAVDNGVVVLAASGNNGYINAIAAPACGSKVIAVGAVDKNDGRTPYSNEGTELDVVAPGTGITSTVPTGSCGLCNPSGFATLSGTSMATPHASAVASLILESNSSLTPAQVMSILENTAFDLGTAGFDTIYGHGRIDAYAAYQSASGQSSGSAYTEILSDNFNDGAIDTVKWAFNNAQENSNCGYHSSARALHFTGSGTRQAATKALDVSSGGKLSFYLKFGTLSGSQSGCENADNGEDVALEYSTNNGNSWTNIKTYDTEAYTSFTLIQENLPVGAKTPSTLFRWRQLIHNGNSYDNWAIDDVLIEIEQQQPQCAADNECDDSLFCNGAEACQSGVCQPGTFVDCSGLNDQCNAGICNEAIDSCMVQTANEGMSCDDGLYCNIGEACQSGVCTGGIVRSCTNSSQCSTGTCDENNDACIVNPVPDGTNCDDGLFCTVIDACSSGTCIGAARDCSDSVSCSVDSCDESSNVCRNIPQNSLCSDNLFCNGIEICDLNIDCISGIPVSCNDNNDCTTDSCNENSDSCSFINTCQQLCWSGQNTYIRRGINNNLRKFCKCAQGAYAYKSYSSNSSTGTAFYYTDSGNNENWNTASIIQSRPANIVRCSDNKWYYANQNYFR